MADDSRPLTLELPDGTQEDFIAAAIPPVGTLLLLDGLPYRVVQIKWYANRRRVSGPGWLDPVVHVEPTEREEST